MKKKFTVLVLSMMLGLAACGTQTETSAETQTPKVSSEASVEDSKGSYAPSSEQTQDMDVELKEGDVTNQIYLLNGMKFTSSEPLEFVGEFRGNETGWQYGNAYIGFADYTNQALEIPNTIYVPEGYYGSQVTPITENSVGNVWLGFVTYIGESKIYISLTSRGELEDKEERFLKVVADFLKTNNVQTKEVSKVNFDREYMDENGHVGRFTSPSDISNEWIQFENGVAFPVSISMEYRDKYRDWHIKDPNLHVEGYIETSIYNDYMESNGFTLDDFASGGLKTSEGVYSGLSGIADEHNPGGSTTFSFLTLSNKGDYLQINLYLSDDEVVYGETISDDQVIYGSKIFMQVVEDFLKSGNTEINSVSDITFDVDYMPENQRKYGRVKGRFISSDEIATEQ